MHRAAVFEAYKIRPGFVLAGFEDMNYKISSMTLDVGDMIFQYTNGVTERATNVKIALWNGASGAGSEPCKRQKYHRILHEVKRY